MEPNAAKPTQEATAPVDDGSVSQDVEVEEAAPVEAPPEQAPPAEDEIVDPVGDEIVPEAPPVKLREFRNDKGEVDLDRLEVELAQRGNRAQQLADFEMLSAKYPGFKLEVAKALKAEGRQLSPDMEALLATSVKPVIKANPQPGTEQIENWKATGSTQQQIDKFLNGEYNKYKAGGATDYQLALWIDTWVTQPKLEATLATRIKAREDTEQQTRTQRDSIEAVRVQCAQAVKDWTPKDGSPNRIIAADPNSPWGYRIIDKRINEWIQKHNPNCSVTKAIRLAAMDMGRLKLQAAKAAAKPGVARTGIQSRPVTARAPKQEDGAVYQEMEVEE